jgi:hypothetical protein
MARQPRNAAEAKERARALKRRFDAAHQEGMASLKHKDYARLSEAIAEEQAIVKEQQQLIEQAKQPAPQIPARTEKNNARRRQS